MKVRLHFDYYIDPGTIEEWHAEGRNGATESILLATDLLAGWLMDGGIPEEGVNATIMEDDGDYE